MRPHYPHICEKCVETLLPSPLRVLSYSSYLGLTHGVVSYGILSSFNYIGYISEGVGIPPP